LHLSSRVAFFDGCRTFDWTMHGNGSAGQTTAREERSEIIRRTVGGLHRIRHGQRERSVIGAV
jgi:hypothetical protein